VIIYFGQIGDRIHPDCIKQANRHTISETQTSIGAVCLSPIQRGNSETGWNPFIFTCSGPVFTGSVATNHSNPVGNHHFTKTQMPGHLIHGFGTSHRTNQMGELVRGDTSLCKGPASGVATATAI
jgi:hypothetical protein